MKATDPNGFSPLHWAASAGKAEVARALIAAGADPNARSMRGFTALESAFNGRRPEAVEALLQGGLTIESKGEEGRALLHRAAATGFLSLVEHLIFHGAEPTPGRGPQDVASLLTQPLQEGEAIVWSLGHCGFAVKTRSRLLIFDYFSRGGSRPEKPSLANSFVDPGEIKAQDVVVFVSHSHGDHFDPVILSWQSTVRNIRYIFGWKAGKGDRAIDMPAPRAAITLDGIQVFTVNGEHNDVPEVACLVKVDGLSIYHAGDYLGPIDSLRPDMDYLLRKAAKVDIAFVGKFTQAESLRPGVVFPMHGANREYMYGAFAREAAEKNLPLRVICPENKGDRFTFMGREFSKEK